MKGFIAAVLFILGIASYFSSNCNPSFDANRSCTWLGMPLSAETGAMLMFVSIGLIALGIVTVIVSYFIWKSGRKKEEKK